MNFRDPPIKPQGFVKVTAAESPGRVFTGCLKLQSLLVATLA